VCSILSPAITSVLVLLINISNSVTHKHMISNLNRNLSTNAELGEINLRPG
jgi:hypothetical protein